MTHKKKDKFAQYWDWTCNDFRFCLYSWPTMKLKPVEVYITILFENTLGRAKILKCIYNWNCYMMGMLSVLPVTSEVHDVAPKPHEEREGRPK